MNNIEELNIEYLKINARSVANGGAAISSKWAGETILVLIAQLEAAQKLNPLSINVSELEATYIGDIRLHMAAISDWKSRAEKAEAELSAANEKLSKPVVLPSHFDYAGTSPLYRSDIEKAIKAAGFTVEGE
ncbi:hypothetical protein [Yersinia kristensenii]|uniref:hypothetical protein n=1 Tax=Yersinia kristensenii TaxID=28152 RepID=UPI00119E1EA9|nr:hypothetical protein [Yersinia kristensenii]